MIFALHLCWRAYDLTLRVYPRELREEFGCEMSHLFHHQTLEAWVNGGWRALLPVLWCASTEFWTEGLLFRMRSPEVIAAASSLVCTWVAFTVLLWALANPLGVKAIGDRIWHLGGARTFREHGAKVGCADPGGLRP